MPRYIQRHIAEWQTLPLIAHQWQRSSPRNTAWPSDHLPASGDDTSPSSPSSPSAIASVAQPRASNRAGVMGVAVSSAIITGALRRRSCNGGGTCVRLPCLRVGQYLCGDARAAATYSSGEIGNDTFGTVGWGSLAVSVIPKNEEQQGETGRELQGTRIPESAPAVRMLKWVVYVRDLRKL